MKGLCSYCGVNPLDKSSIAPFFTIDYYGLVEVCYLKCRPYRTQAIVWQVDCYLKCRPDGTQTVVQ
ncbi:MAG: hypothetical protein RBR69_06020 [Candidatus Cloacimonadaceae bacterium]|nr:hypothetical protein [Candidatus Cloacimonadota bacterium]MDY0127670.1 hypothetical protein [Candidatus Cloacimonadaceae bacterium]